MKYTQYASYLVRLWLELSDDTGTTEQWHIEVECIQTNQKHQFPDLETLHRFFREQIGPDPPVQDKCQEITRD